MKPLPRVMTAHIQYTAMQGVTLIETMIAMTIGLIILAGIGYAYLGSRQNFRTQDVLARMQENARTAFEIMDRDIRMAGYLGCPPNTAAGADVNLLASNTDWDKNVLLQPLIGYEKGTTAQTAFPTVGVTPLPGVAGNVTNGDVLTVLHADVTQQYMMASEAGNTITLSATQSLPAGQNMILTDCSTHNLVFQKTNSSSGDALVTHAAWAYTLTPHTAGIPSSPSWALYPLSAATYFIGNNGTEPVLYRKTSSTAWANAAAKTADEVVEGVEDMQFAYAVDTVNNPPSAVSAYVSASAVTSWSQVLGIRVSLVMVSRKSDGNITTTTQKYSLDTDDNGQVDLATETVTPAAGDLYFRKVFTTTIAVKNRLVQ